MILSAHQNQFLGGLRYYEKYLRSDLFCHLNNVQMERHSFVNRNQIKGPNGPIMLTVPCKNMKNYRQMDINEVEIDNTVNWYPKLLKSVKVSYQKAPYYDEIMPWMEWLFKYPWNHLEDLCIASFRLVINKILKIENNRNRVTASDYNFQGQKSDLVLGMCKTLNASEFIFGALGKDYADVEAFNKAGIKVHFQNYEPVEYPQQFGDFVPDMSILDLLMNVAPEDRVKVIMEGGKY
jgi:hypothetical protein